jgi:hypothetical protein
MFSPFHAFSRIFKEHASIRDGGVAINGVSRAALNKIVGRHFQEGMRKPSRNGGAGEVQSADAHKLARHFLHARWRNPDNMDDRLVLNSILHVLSRAEAENCIAVLREVQQFKAGPAGRGRAVGYLEQRLAKIPRRSSPLCESDSAAASQAAKQISIVTAWAHAPWHSGHQDVQPQAKLHAEDQNKQIAADAAQLVAAVRAGETGAWYHAPRRWCAASNAARLASCTFQDGQAAEQRASLSGSPLNQAIAPASFGCPPASWIDPSATCERFDGAGEAGGMRSGTASARGECKFELLSYPCQTAEQQQCSSAPSDQMHQPQTVALGVGAVPGREGKCKAGKGSCCREGKGSCQLMLSRRCGFEASPASRRNSESSRSNVPIPAYLSSAGSSAPLSPWSTGERGAVSLSLAAQCELSASPVTSCDQWVTSPESDEWTTTACCASDNAVSDSLWEDTEDEMWSLMMI